uniref:Uncharacterized protein n=1 Tax=Kalanchoe fedtschenkoi TaxID=63787 RepID=A0A7N0TTV7_KALFE
MGQCVSLPSPLHKIPDSSQDKYRHQPLSLLDSPLPSPVKDRPLPTVVELPKASSNSYGSKDEAFFDSQPWLDSDCDDDFYSVNGDFTPSRGNTPLHHSFDSQRITRSPYWPSSGFTSPAPGPSPKKSLADLFEESGRYATEARNDASPSLPASAVGSPRIAGARSSTRRVRSFKSVKCCLPQLLSGRGFDEGRRVISLSPAQSK